VLWEWSSCRDEPSLLVTNPNHHPGVAEHLANLPTLAGSPHSSCTTETGSRTPESLLANTHPIPGPVGFGVGFLIARSHPITEDRRQKTGDRRRKTEPVSPGGDDSGNG